MENQQVRQIAHKVRIFDLVNSEYIQQSGEWEPNYVSIGDKKISRVNIIANIITNYKSEDGTYATITIDDGSGNIQVKTWKEDTKIFEKVDIGDFILLVGRIKEYNGEKYLVPEIIKKLDNSEWLSFRRKELSKLYGETEVQTQKPVEKTEDSVGQQPILISEESVTDDSSSEGDRQKILNIIEKLSSVEGADKLEIIKESNVGEDAANEIIHGLIRDGEIFEIKPGKVKILG
jgi:RPA family protein